MLSETIENHIALIIQMFELKYLKTCYSVKTHNQ